MTDDLIGQVVADKFRIEGLLARRRNGDLYRARHVLTDKPVSIYLLPPALGSDERARAEFFTEAKAAARIEHPNLLNVADLGTDLNGISYAVCDAFDGETLRDAIDRGGAMDAFYSVLIAKQVAAGLAAAHGQGVIHGNLTAGNVLLSETVSGPFAKIAGFAGSGPMGRDGDILDSVASDFAYLAPEQAGGSEIADERSDIYSLGVLMYEMLAGVPPFTGDKPSDVILKHMEEAPAPLVSFRPDVPAGIEPIILKALAKDPDLRYTSAAEIYEDLEAAAGGSSAAAAAGEGGRKQSIWVTIAMVVIGTAALAGALIYATSVKQTDPATAMQPDANGMPVQPVSPPTGLEEQSLAAMPAMTDSNSNTALVAPETMPGGDGFNPWATGVPPGGVPEYIPPGGEVYTVPGGGSPFMPNCVMQPSGVLLCYGPPPANANVRPSPTPRTTPADNANVEATPSPTATPAQPSPTATPRPTGTPRPAATPTATPAANRPDPGDIDRS